MSLCLTCGHETQMASASCSNCGARMVQGPLLVPPTGESAAKFWLREWFSFQGRISRSSFWLQHELPMTGILLMALFLDTVLKANGAVAGIVMLLSVWPNAATCVKRAHDRGRSGWFVILMAVPLLSIWPLIELYFLKGTNGVNEFGPDPLRPSTFNSVG
jgi:uncharacterized membrane protein YhaH (DUF805 family)